MSTTDPEQPLLSTSNPPSQIPLLPSARAQLASLRASQDWIGSHIVAIYGENAWIWQLRHALQNFLSSKWGHYFVLCLVSIDISCIFADFLISLHICEHTGEKGFNKRAWSRADKLLDDVSLVFSCLFMAELLGSIFAFGFSYFESAFHCFDAAVIIAGFVIDIVLRGPHEEAGSLVVVLRLWRVFKIIEEFSTGANDEMEGLYEHIDKLREENESMKGENETLRKRLQGNGSGRINDPG